MQKLVRAGRWAIDVGLVLALGTAVLGHVLRDRVPALALLTYSPLVPIAFAVVVYDGIQRGRTWGRYRLAAVAALAGLWGLSGMVGWRSAPPADRARPPLAVVLQNAWWGGGWDGTFEIWQEGFSRLAAADPDLILLSEAPDWEWLEPVFGDEWTYTVAEMPDWTWYRMVVASRWPHRDVQQFDVFEGAAVVVVVDRPEAPVRVMMVDGRSWPGRDRPRMLVPVAELLAAQRAAGTPVDIVAGDFNAPARSVGFDAFREHYWLVAQTCGQWRGTWPRWLPLIDVDHIWVRKGWTSEGCTLATDRLSDHVGLRATLR